MVECTSTRRTEMAIAQLQKMIDRLKSAGPGYEIDVIMHHSVDDWMAQLAIKVTRARYATSVEKQLDELKDVGNYAALLMSLVEDVQAMQPQKTTMGEQ